MALSHLEKRFAARFYRAIGTPLSAGLARALEAEDWDTIATCKVDPRAYVTSQEYFLDASAASFLRKHKALPSSFNKKAAALGNWLRGERDCYRTNERLSPYLEGFTHPDWNSDVAHHLDELRQKVSRILGRAPAMEHLHPRHGPGATFSDKSVASTVADKMGSNGSITNGALWFRLDWLGTAWGRNCSLRNVSLSTVRGNRFTTAPKDATKDRPIAAEPSVNIFYQLGLGRAIRQRLKNVGIDLDFGQEVHRRTACEASISGSCATIDLSNASDTVAYNLVRLLLPPDWFALLAELRSSHTRMGPEDLEACFGRKPAAKGQGSWVRLEKFSSMGNGFTFELETLIFFAIADYATSVALAGEEGRATLVYGDDIICDSRGAENVTSLLRFLGFSLNDDKSFVSGGFRESCGGDYLVGRPVRPYFWKEPIDEPQQLIALANGIRQLGSDLFGGLGPFAGLWFSIQDQLPTRVRQCRGPKGLGDAVVHDDEVNWSWTSIGKTTIRGYVPVKHEIVPWGEFHEEVVYACGLYGLDMSLDGVTPRESVLGYGFRKLWPVKSDWVPVPYIRPHWLKEVEVIDMGPRGPNYSKATRVCPK